MKPGFLSFQDRPPEAGLAGLIFRRAFGVRTPTRLQFQTTECGVAALGMILAHFGRRVPLEEVREVTGVSRDCMNAADLVRGARHYGLDCKVLRLKPEGLPALGYPCIVHLRFIHFSVLEEMTPTNVRLNDPSSGRIEVPMEKFYEDFTGVALKLTPTADFCPDGHPARRTRMPLSPSAAVSITAATAAGLLLALPTILFARLLGRYAELRTTVGAGDAVPALIGGLLAAGILRFVLKAIQAESLSALQQSLSLDGARFLMRHILSLPYAFFVYRMPDGLHAAVYSCEYIARLLCTDLLPAAFNLAAVPVILAAVWHYHAATAGVLLCLGALYVIALALLFRWRRGETRQHRYQTDEELSQLASSLEGIESSKVAGQDQELFAARIGSAAGQQRLRQEYGIAEGLALVSPNLLEGAVVAAVLILSGHGLIAGQLGTGDALSLLVLAFGLCGPLRALAGTRGKLDALQHTKPHIDDVLEYPKPPDSDVPPASGERTGFSEGAALRMENVVFGYAPLKPPLLTGLSLELIPGEQLGLCGPSGGGKSTVAGLMAGMHRPWSGSVRYGETPAGHMAPSLRSKRIAWVDKSPFFFEGTIRENLCLWEDGFDAESLREALRDACLEEVIADRAGGLDAPIAPRGRNFSGGQCQRLEIARALLRRPAILVLDEATDALDPALELRLRANLRRRGCTLVIISHRASTLTACDRVLRVAGGKIVPADDGRLPERDLSSSSAAAAEPSQAVDSNTASTEPDRTIHLTEAFRLVAAHQQKAVTVPDAASLPAGAEGVYALASHNGMFARRVRFVVSRWWHRDHGPLLAFTREGRRPVALLPAGSRYRIADPAGLENGPLDPAAAAAKLDSFAYRLYPKARLDSDGPLSLFGEGIRRCRRDMVRAGLMGLVLAALSAMLPLGAAVLFGQIVPAGGNGDMIRIGGAIAVLILAMGLFEAGRVLASLRLEGGMDASVMAALLQRIVRMDVAFVRRLAPEDLARSLLGVPRLLNHLRGAPLQQALSWGMIPAGLALLAWMDLRLLFFGLLLLIPAVLAPALSAAASLGLERRHFQKRVAARRLLFYVMSGIGRLRLLDAEARAAGHWEAGYTAEKALERCIRRQEAFREAFADAYPWLALAGMAAIAGTWAPVPLWLAPALTIAWWQCTGSASAAGAAASSMIRAAPFVEHLGLITGAPLEPEGKPLGGLPCKIEVRNVGYRYEGTATPVLEDISLHVDPGELVAIAGPSGSGKSTLLRLLLGFDQPQTGEVRVGGTRLAALDRPAWRRRMGAVLQGDRISGACTLRGQICGLAPYGLADAWRAAEAALLAPDILRMPMGMQAIAEQSKISTGQHQRLLIARQLLRRPRLLILDEATNAITEEMQAELFANLRRLGLTCVIVTHRESALAIADRVYVLEQGRMAFSGPPGDFFRKDRLRELLSAESTVIE